MGREENGDKGVEPRSGVSARGVPLSLNRAPAADLEPWVARIVVSRVSAPPDHFVQCSVFNDIAFSRVCVDGEWETQAADGPFPIGREPLLVGPQSRKMDLWCRGSFATVNIGFRPGAVHRLFHCALTPLVDRLERGDRLGLATEENHFGYPPDASADDWADIAEQRMRAFVAQAEPKEPDPVSAAFELASFEDPTITPGDFADRQGISLRQLERIVRRDFGLTPRTVLRRARAIDLACEMLGIADEEEADDFLLRYFDQSHLIREFQHFFGFAPQAFRTSPHPLLTLNLEARSARRLEELKRLGSGDQRPWNAKE